jgi:hypothetical protein
MTVSELRYLLYAYHIPNIIKKMNQKIIFTKYSIKVEYFNLFHKYGIILFIPKKVEYFFFGENY